MPPALRRRAWFGRSLLVAVCVAGLTGCAGIGQPAPYDSPGINGLVIPTPSPAPDDFVAGVDNPWLPLESGARWRYAVSDDGRSVGSIISEVLAGSTDVAGLSATGVRTTVDVDGGEATTTTHYYAQDVDGNVWLVGLDADDADTAASWRAGENGAQAGLAMPADPRLGDGWLTASVPGRPETSTVVEDQGRDLVQMRSEQEADTTRTIHASGVGPVSVEDVDAGWLAELVAPAG